MGSGENFWKSLSALSGAKPGPSFQTLRVSASSSSR